MRSTASCERLKQLTQEARDLENFMRAQKPKIDSLINEQLYHGPQKVRLCAKLQLIKYHNDQPDNAEDERIEIYANSLLTPVYANGLTIAAYWGMVEKMMSVLTTFASMGSGWVLESAESRCEIRTFQTNSRLVLYCTTN